MQRHGGECEEEVQSALHSLCAAEALFCKGLEASIPRPSELPQSIQGMLRAWITELHLLLRVGSGI